MGETINSADADYCPTVSPDGKYFYYTQGQDILWVDIAVLDAYRVSNKR